MRGANIYRDIAERTGGEIYIGVVGPVRSGKSSFIKKFMECAVLPNIENSYDRQRASDELPQSAGGRTVMTTEPKFVPDEAVTVSIDGDTHMKVKLIDCVGYLIPGILGDTEDGEVRLVNTPWSDSPVPFSVAAETGTRRVIEEHSTIGVLVTCDGSFGEIPRESYIEAEGRVAAELTELGKPFAIVLNSSRPESPEAEALAMELEAKYDAPVALMNVLNTDTLDVEGILRLIIPEFPLRCINVELPKWIGVLESGHSLKSALMESITYALEGVVRVGDAVMFKDKLAEKAAQETGEEPCEIVAELKELDMGSGTAVTELRLPDRLFYRTMGEVTGLDISSEAELLSTLKALAAVKREYDKYASALDSVTEHGYGIVMPEQEELTLYEPELVRQSGGYGIRIRAAAPSIHMIRANVETELSPIVGTQQQSEELVEYLTGASAEAPEGIWNVNLFGKTVYELVSDGLRGKVSHLTDDAKARLGETISRVINEGAGGLICIIL